MCPHRVASITGSSIGKENVVTSGEGLPLFEAFLLSYESHKLVRCS